MVASCLDQDPSKRPSADQLLEYSFFKNCEGLDFLFKKVFNGLPNVEERFEEAKALHDGTSSLLLVLILTQRVQEWKLEGSVAGNFMSVNSSLTQNSVSSQKMMQLWKFSVLEAKPSKIQINTKVGFSLSDAVFYLSRCRYFMLLVEVNDHINHNSIHVFWG